MGEQHTAVTPGDLHYIYYLLLCLLYYLFLFFLIETKLIKRSHKMAWHYRVAD